MLELVHHFGPQVGNLVLGRHVLDDVAELSPISLGVVVFDDIRCEYSTPGFGRALDVR